MPKKDRPPHGGRSHIFFYSIFADQAESKGRERPAPETTGRDRKTPAGSGHGKPETAA